MGMGVLSYNFLRWLRFDIVEPDYLLGFLRLLFFVDSFIIDDMGIKNASLELAILVSFVLILLNAIISKFFL